MVNLLITILDMSITASYTILAVCVCRLLMKRAPKYLTCILWLFVGFRLLCPFSLESMLSLVPPRTALDESILYAQEPAVSSGLPALDARINEFLQESYAPVYTSSVNPLQLVFAAAAVLWCAGMAFMLIYGICQWLRLRHKTRTAVPFQTPQGIVYQCDNIGSPFLFGLLRPRIYVPFSMDEETLYYVTAHEQAHCRRADHWSKAAAYCLLSVYWFHPLVWLSYFLFCRDIEYACDEKVLTQLAKEERADYAEALLFCTSGQRRVSACPVSFGASDLKNRVKQIAGYRKPSFFVIAAGILACVIIAVCFLTRSGSSSPDESIALPPETGSETVANTAWPEAANEILLLPQQSIEEAAIPAAPAVWPADGSLVAGGVSLDYVGNDRVIFHGYFGLFVYDKAALRIARAVNLEPIGCHYTQGENACETSVSEDGRYIYLHPMSEHIMYRYDVENNLFTRMAFDASLLLQNAMLAENPLAGSGDGGVYSSQRFIFRDGENDYDCYLFSPDGSIGSLTYVESDMVFQLFAWSDDVLFRSGQDDHDDLRILYLSPVENARISNGFGMHTHPLTGQETAHNGIDYAAAEGTPVLAAADGTIYETGYDVEFGNFIILEHSNGEMSYYTNLGDILTTAGTVLAGEQIATVGNSGLGTGAHLHFAVSDQDGFMDPSAVMR